jgi:hypothetical protein
MIGAHLQEDLMHQYSVVTLFAEVAADVAGPPRNRYKSSVTGGISGQAALRVENCDKMYRPHKIWNVGTIKTSNWHPFTR